MKIKICIGESCHLQGAEEVVKSFKKQIDSQGDAGSEEDAVQLAGCFCMNNCRHGRVSVSLGVTKHAVRVSDADTFFTAHVLPKG